VAIKDLEENDASIFRVEATTYSEHFKSDMTRLFDPGCYQNRTYSIVYNLTATKSTARITYSFSVR
jgi:hypothetical protein